MKENDQICGYRLIDCGNESRLEEFADVICQRPAPMAQWAKKLGANEWNAATLSYDRDSKSWSSQDQSNWQVRFRGAVFNLECSSQGQVGIFPEQLENWKWLHSIITPAQESAREIEVLNGFAHTGGSTMSCAIAGAKVCHLDAAKSAVNRARENAASSDIAPDSIRWIVDDAVKFMEREVRRGKRYDGIILDPPAFGRLGKKVWKLEKNLPQLLELGAELLSEKPLFFLLSCHPHGWTKHDLKSAVNKMLKSALKKVEIKSEQYTTLNIPSENGNALPLGLCARLVF